MNKKGIWMFNRQFLQYFSFIVADLLPYDSVWRTLPIFHQSFTNYIAFEIISYQRLEISWLSNLLKKSVPGVEQIEDIK